eukprot:11290422-Alexandrium_andersonii.AAC.1
MATRCCKRVSLYPHSTPSAKLFVNSGPRSRNRTSGAPKWAIQLASKQHHAASEVGCSTRLARWTFAPRQTVS